MEPTKPDLENSPGDPSGNECAGEILGKGEERFRSLIQSASDIITILEADGTIGYVSPAVGEMLGYRPGEMVARSIFGYVHRDDAERVSTAFKEILDAPKIHRSLGFRVLHADGSWRYLEHVVNNLLNDPSVNGIVINSRDVTERKCIEEALKESEERFRSAFEDAPIGVALVDLDGYRFRVNRALCEMLGCPEEELLGKDYLEDVHPDDRGISVDHFRKALEERAGSYTLERRYICTDGSVVWNLSSVSLIRDSKGNPSHFVCLHQDITDRKQAEEALKQSEERFRSLVQNSYDVITVLDDRGTILYQSPSVRRVLGDDPEEKVGKNVLEPGRVHREDVEKVRQAYAYVLANPEIARTLEYRIRHADGSWRYIESVGINLLDDPNVSGVVVNFRDVTERKKTEEALKRSEERYRAVVEKQTDLICRFLPDKALTFVNEAFARYFGKEREELIGHNFMQLIPSGDHTRVEEQLSRLSEESPVRTVEHRVLTPDGEVRWQQWTDRAIFDAEGRIVEYQSVGRDITERKQAEERLQYQATHDLLTDLPNRHLFMDRLERALRLTRRRRGRKVAVLYLDLDNFKVVNDSLGHEAGDLLLVMVGERLRWCLRPEDTLARFGGDEFAVLLEEVEIPSDAGKVAERIVERFREPFVLEGREFVVRPSIGIALGAAPQNSSEELLRDADTAMYQTKEQGAGYRVVDSRMYEQALRRLKLESDLRRAIEAEEFVVCYQPIVNLQTDEVWGVEALVRWEHPEQQDLLAPSQFVPVAEEAGLVVPMGRWVLEEACRQGAKWQREHPHVPPLVISVNLSAKQLQHPDVAETIEETLRETGLEASSLGLDITETLYIEALRGHTAALDKLKHMGVRISIDDFGTGYSSLSYLKRLPADTLKIDKSFIRGFGEDIEDTAIVQMIIDLAHTLGMEVVAEGVETAEQVANLRQMGCDLAQGFYFAKPIPPEEIAEFQAG